MRIYFATVSLALLSVAGSFLADPETDAAKEIQDRSRMLVRALADKDYAGATRDFDDVMKKALPADKLREVWTSLTDQFGAFIKAGGIRTERVQKYEIVYVSCAFEKGALDTKVVFGSDRRVTGLFFVPAKAPAADKPPEYVRPETFQESEQRVGSGEWVLPATLTVPRGDGPFPAVVLVHGSGPHDRDETIMANKPFRDLAWGLGSRKVAVLRYEKRTKEYGTKLAAKKATLTVQEEVIDDARAAIALLRKTEKIDPRRIYVLGHSLGAVLAPRVGAHEADVAGIVLLAANTRPLEDVIVDQFTYLLSKDGLTDAKKQQLAQIKEQAARVKDPKLSAVVPAEELPLSIPAAYWLDLRAYDPAATAARDFLRPMLILQGERDYQVTMEDFQGWKNQLGNRRNVTLKSYSRLNHLFMAGEGKATPQEYEKPGHVDREVVEDIAAWIHQPTRRSSPSDNHPRPARDGKEARTLRKKAGVAVDAKDWPMYNCDVLGWRHNAGETALNKADVARLEEKWRFPPKGADFEIGVIHATPVIVNGYAYFGTVNKAAFYKLTPEGKVKWSFPLNEKDDRVSLANGFPSGIYSSALVTEDSVYFATLAGFVYALDRDSGKEKWRLDMRAKTFPDAHPLNGTFASPILADGKIVIAGGALEQGIRWFLPKYEGFTGRGFVVALEPESGRIAWKYNVGPKPERLDPPIIIPDAWGKHVFHFGPATSTVWCTPSYHAASQTLFFGTDTNNAPRRPTPDDPRLDTRYACAVIAIDARDGSEKWATQINRGDVWIANMSAYDPKTGLYKDQSIGDTPKICTIMWKGTPTLVIGFGCKNGGFYVVRASDGMILAHTPLYTGPPTDPPNPPPDKRTLALPGPTGGLQTGCAADGKRVYTNGMDANQLGTQESPGKSVSPTAGRVVAISLDANEEHWRHERPKVASVGGPAPKRVVKNVGDPVASGIASANDVVYFTTLMSSKLVALDASTGKELCEIHLPPVWSGPAVSRGRVYVGTGNMVLPDVRFFGPTRTTGTLFSFGLPGEDEVSRLGVGKE